MRIQLGAGVVIAAMIPSIFARAQPPAHEFEVVSIRSNRSGEQRYRIRTPPGAQFVATNVTVKALILDSFDIKNFQLSGAPSWIDNERYDITAKVETTEDARMLTAAELAPLVRALLTSRFQLAFHHTLKISPLLALIVAKGGPRLHRNTGSPGHETSWGKDHINAHDVTISEFGQVLETQLGRIVVDDTKIPGTFDFDLTWTPEQTADPSGPSVFTAIQEQYGLQLKPRKGPIDVLVIDRLERPSDN